MLVRKITNISNAPVNIRLENGASLDLAPGDSLENVAVYDLARVRSSLSVQFSLND